MTYRWPLPAWGEEVFWSDWFSHLALQAGDKGRLDGERVGGRHEGVRHGVHVVGEVEHESSEGWLVVVENLWGRTGWPVEGESVRVGHMPDGKCQSIATEEITIYGKHTELGFTHIALHDQTCSRRGNQKANPSSWVPPASRYKAKPHSAHWSSLSRQAQMAAGSQSQPWWIVGWREFSLGRSSMYLVASSSTRPASMG